MTERLASFCLGLWSLGLFGMGAARGLFHLEPGATWFDAGALLWAVGGLTYCFLGVLTFLESKGR